MVAKPLSLDKAPAALDWSSRLVCQDRGALVLAALESDQASGPWIVCDTETGAVAVGSGLTPIADGHLDAEGRGLLLTYRGLTAVQALPELRVGDSHGAGLGTGKEDHEDTLTRLSGGLAVVGRWGRPLAKVVDLASGQVVQRLEAQPPYLALPSGDGEVRFWSLGSGTVRTLDAASRRPVQTTEAPRAFAACHARHGTVALVGEIREDTQDSLRHALLADFGLASLLRRLKSSFHALRLVTFDSEFQEQVATTEDWLWGALRQAGGHLVARLTTDGTGRPVLTTSSSLTVVDSLTLRPLAQQRTESWPGVWQGTNRAVHQSGDRQVTILEWL